MALYIYCSFMMLFTCVQVSWYCPTVRRYHGTAPPCFLSVKVTLYGLLVSVMLSRLNLRVANSIVSHDASEPGHSGMFQAAARRPAP